MPAAICSQLRHSLIGTNIGAGAVRVLRELAWWPAVPRCACLASGG